MCSLYLKTFLSFFSFLFVCSHFVILLLSNGHLARDHVLSLIFVVHSYTLCLLLDGHSGVLIDNSFWSSQLNSAEIDELLLFFVLKRPFPLLPCFGCL